MLTNLQKWTQRLLLVTLMMSLVYLTSCAPKVVVIPADQMITRLPNGNYEVTPAWLQERYRLERWLTEELKKCRK